MSTVTTTYTYAHSVTYVTDKMLNSLKEIIRLSGLSPEKLTSDWDVLERGIKTWLNTGHLQYVHLEVYNPRTDVLIGRWDFEVFYGFNGGNTFWADAEAICFL